MVTKAIQPPPEPTRAEAIANDLEKLRDVVEPIVRNLVVGDPNKGRMRRSILFAVAGVGLVLGGIFAGIGITALLFLAFTDQVVEL